MRRMAFPLALVVSVMLGVVTLAGVQFHGTGPSVVDRIIGGAQWALDTPVEDSSVSANDCDPAVAAACGQIADAMTAVVVQAAAFQAISFTYDAVN